MAKTKSLPRRFMPAPCRDGVLRHLFRRRPDRRPARARPRGPATPPTRRRRTSLRPKSPAGGTDDVNALLANQLAELLKPEISLAIRDQVSHRHTRLRHEGPRQRHAPFLAQRLQVIAARASRVANGLCIQNSLLDRLLIRDAGEGHAHADRNADLRPGEVLCAPFCKVAFGPPSSP